MCVPKPQVRASPSSAVRGLIGAKMIGTRVQGLVAGPGCGAWLRASKQAAPRGIGRQGGSPAGHRTNLSIQFDKTRHAGHLPSRKARNLSSGRKPAVLRNTLRSAGS